MRLVKTIIIAVLCVILAAIIFFSSVYFTTEDQFAVVTTFGTPSVVENSGLHFMIPFVQQRTIISKNIRGIEIGYNSETEQTIESESVMITVDYNFVDVDFYLEWKVTDPIKYLYSSDDPEGILKMLSQSYIRDTIGLYDVDSVITTGKNEIQSAIKDKISARIEEEDLGIALVNITIQDAEPPTEEVQNAFKAVETAKQGAETATNNADRYYNEVIPAARAEADEAIRQAEAYKQARINDATAQAERFTALFEEYAQFPEITKQRLFYETMSDILPDLKIIIKSENDTINTYMPVEADTPSAVVATPADTPATPMEGGN
ncbi:MAG: FtsH protease activity modulator HflK [Oscillospiraceae bacterium]|nr:FtsH protease activity modulator HflK [Oscillospiraceae bacterium]